MIETAATMTADLLTRNGNDPRTHNPHWPLPYDYGELTAEGKRQARRYLISDHSTPARWAIAWLFFSLYYLWPKDASFYRAQEFPPPAHIAMIHDGGKWPFSAFSAPRSFAKSTLFGKSVPLVKACACSVLRTRFTMTYCTCKMDFVRLAFDDVIAQLENNRYIKNDFGALKPAGRSGRWSGKEIRLPCGFHLFGLAIGGKNRGPHPDLFVMDDVEDDPDNPESGPRLTEQLERKLFKVFVPMMDRNTSFILLGTKVRLNSYLYRAQHSTDPRFEEWNRRDFLEVDKEGRSSWEGKFGAERRAELTRRLGDDIYDEEIGGRRRRKQGQVYAYDAAYHTYRVRLADPAWHTDPLQSGALLVRPIRREDAPADFEEEPAGEFLQNCFRFTTVDSNKKVTATSDYAAVATMALDHRLRLWVLDLWMKRAKREELIEVTLAQAFKWRSRVIGPEAVTIQQHLADMLHKEVDERFRDAGWTPFVMPLRWAYATSKDDRLIDFAWRYDRDSILLPAPLLTQWPYNELLNQIIHYNGDCQQLRHDDGIDVLAMSNEVLKNRRAPAMRTRVERSALSQALDDPIRRELGIGALSGLDPTTLSKAEIHELRQRYMRRMGLPTVQPEREPEEIGAVELLKRCGMKKCGAVWVCG